MLKYQNLDQKSLEKVASLLAGQIGKTPVKIGLIGPLGAGKTTFTKSFGKALGIKKIKSPSFIVSHRYPINSRFFYHLDFYRLKSQSELEHLGIEEIMNGNATALIEWVNKFPKIKKECDLIINIKLGKNNTRNVTLSN